MTADFFNHLWQSTLFAGVIALLSLALAPQSRAAALRSLVRRVGQVPRAVCDVGRSRGAPRMAAGAGADQVGRGVAGCP